MTNNGHSLTKQEFDSIYSKVPRLTVEIIIKEKDGGIYLTKRSIEPCRGQWHLPGGTVRFGEPMIDAVKRIARRELNIDVKKLENKGYIEYPSHYKNGLDSPVGIVFEILDYSGSLIINQESQDGGWFNKIPDDMHADQDTFLLANSYMNR